MEQHIYQDIFSYITSQEAAYKTPIQLPGNWSWSMQKHLELSYLYNNSQLETGKDDFKPVKNITRPLLNLQHRAEDIEVKDVEIYIDSPDDYHLSFLVKKYHDDVFVVENDIDTFFDELNVARIDYGGGLSKKLNKPRPEVVPLHSIVFCDQTDILSGPIGLKHFYSPDQLLEMASAGWGDTKNGATATLDEVIVLSREMKKENQNNTTSNTPGRYVEVYEVHGNFPNRFIDEADTSEKFSSQIHIVCFYQKSDSTKGKIVLYHAEEKTSPFKLTKRDEVYGRALGFGGAEELFEAQVWTNYDMIRMQKMLDGAAVTLYKSTDLAVAARHPTGLKDLENGEIIDLAPGTDINQIDTLPRNLQLFVNSIDAWENHAKEMSSATNALLGQPAAGQGRQAYNSIALLTSQGQAIHDYRKGQYAKHLEEIYRDWIIPHIIREITKGATFLSELSVEELNFVAEKMSICAWNNHFFEKAVNLQNFEEGEREQFVQQFKEDLRKKGSKHFIEILKGEFKDKKLSIKINIASKQKNLPAMIDQITKMLQFALVNPQGFAQVMQIPGMARIFNEIVEYSGLSSVDFMGIDKMAEQQPQPQQGQPQPQQPQQPQIPPQMPQQMPQQQVAYGK